MDKNKKNHVLELIRKSLQLNIPEDEIIATLIEANLSRDDAAKLLVEAKEIEKKPVPKEEPVNVISDLSIGDQISKQLGLEKNILNVPVEKIDEKNASNSKEIDAKNIFIKKEEPNDFGLKIKSKKDAPIKKGLFSGFRKKEPVKKPVVGEKSFEGIPKIELGDDSKTDSNVDVLISGLQKEAGIIKPIIDEKSSDGINEVEQKDSNKKEKKEVSEDSKFISKSKKALSEIQNNNPGKTNISRTVNPSPKEKNFDALWRKGIVVAVNTKLSEMKKLKDEIDDLLAQKVDAAIKKETKQFKVLLDSQKDLIISSNKEALEQKQKEITFIIDSKITELKKQSAGLTEYVEMIEKSKAEQQKALAEIKQTLDGARKTKSQLLVEMNSELIKSKSSAQETMDKAQKKIDELEAKVNKTLEFEKNIAEGMLAEAEQKIERLTISKADNLLEELEIELNKLKTIEKNIDLDRVEQKIKVLDEFKKEFLNSMEENLAKINGAIVKLNEKNEQASKALDEKSLAIDAKIEELTKFEKLFTENLEKIISNKK
jgi:hypothetical protein